MGDAGNSSTDWQLLCTKTRDRLSHLLHTKLWADCTFLVGDEEPESIAAHKFVLAMSSPVFDTMFNGSMPEGKGPVRVPDVQPEAFKIMLKFLYCDEATLRTYQEASEVYCAARKYMLPFIQTKCASFLEWRLTPVNACFVHEFATLFEEKSLLKASLRTFKRKTKEVLKEGSFYETHINTIAALFSQNELDIDSELDLFNALEKYTAETAGLKSLKRPYKGSESPSKRPRIEDAENKTMSEAENIETRLNMERDDDEQNEDEKKLIEVRQAVSHIRFLILSVQQFTVAALSVLLTEEEAYAITMNIVGVPEKLPKGISANKQPRGVREWSPDYSATFTSTPQKGPGQSPIVVIPRVPSAAPVFEAMCHYNVYNFKTRKRPVKSQPFYTDQLKWHVNLVPGVERQQDGEELKFLGVYVECSSAASKGWACSAHVTIELLGQTVQNLRRSFTNNYNYNSTSNGYRHLLPWSMACNHYLRSNTLQIDVRVVATITQA